MQGQHGQPLHPSIPTHTRPPVPTISTPTTAVARVRVASTVARVSASPHPASPHCCTTADAMADRKMSPTSCTWPALRGWVVEWGGVGVENGLHALLTACSRAAPAVLCPSPATTTPTARLTHGKGHAAERGKGGLVQRAGQEHQLDQGAQHGAEEGVLAWDEGGGSQGRWGELRRWIQSTLARGARPKTCSWAGAPVARAAASGLFDNTPSAHPEDDGGKGQLQRQRNDRIDQARYCGPGIARSCCRLSRCLSRLALRWRRRSCSCTGSAG